MEFKSREELAHFIYGLPVIGRGSQGECRYRKKDEKVYKILSKFSDPYYDPDFDTYYSEDEILKFKNVKNDTAIFSEDVISINGEIYGDIQKYVKAKNLYKINPFLVNLDNFEGAVIKALDDVDLLSRKGITTYDVTYNTLYQDDVNSGKMYLIDTLDWNYSSLSTDKVRKMNAKNFSYEIFLFLVDSIFSDFVDSSSQLSELFEGKEDCLEFIRLFRNELSEVVGRKIDFLADAKVFADKRVKETPYQRDCKVFYRVHK